MSRRYWLANILFLLIFNFMAIGLLSLGERLFAILVLCGPAGQLLNFLAIVANGWKMPVLIKNSFQKKELAFSNDHAKLTKQTKLKCLCDIYTGPVSIYSIGDIFIKSGEWAICLAILKLAIETFL